MGCTVMLILCMWNVYCFVTWQLSTKNSNEFQDCVTCIGFNLQQETTVHLMVDCVCSSMDYKHDVVVDDLDVASHMCCDDLPLSPEFTALAEAIMTEEEGLKVPEKTDDARNLYMTLINEINKKI